MQLIDIINNDRTDKNTAHSYLATYERLFSPKKDLATNVLEIGIQRGGSIKLWADYFEKAQVYGLDKMDRSTLWPILEKNPRIILHLGVNAYETKEFDALFGKQFGKFDICIDDGPHTLDSMKYFVKNYSKLLKEDGILIIEDVQKIEWIDILKQETPDTLKQYVEVFDLRTNKKRYDDILFVINKSK